MIIGSKNTKNDGFPSTITATDIAGYLTEREVYKDNLDEYFTKQIAELAPELFDVFSQSSPLLLHGMTDVLRPLKLAKQRLRAQWN